MPSMEEMMFGRQQEEFPKLAPDIEVLRLRDAFNALQTAHRFAVGDLVRQKPLARRYRNLGDNDQAIVLEVLPEPIVNQGEAGSTHYRELQDLVIGILKRDPEEGDWFLPYHVYSRCFEPVLP